jgi:type VI secretion system secreted protein Hcp
MAFAYFLKIDGITGDSTVSGHLGEITLESWSFGLSGRAPSAPGGAGAGKVTFEDVYCAAHSGGQSPQIFLSVASGQQHATAVLSSVNGQQDAGLPQIAMSGVLVSSYQAAGQDGVAPIETFTLTYGKIQLSQPGAPAGSPVIGWDRIANQKL